MAVLGTKFNAADHDTEQRPDYEELPNGIYALEIEASDVVPTKAGTGTILKTTNTVLEPEDFKGRKLFNNYNLENPNEVAQRIGQQQFASLCRAIGVQEVEDSEQLHFHRYVVSVKLGKPSKDGQYPARAEIFKYWFPDEGNVPEPAVDESQPANDNRRDYARNGPKDENGRFARRFGEHDIEKRSDNGNSAATSGKRPWGQRAA